MPPQVTQTYERSYDFAWLGVLARAKPITDIAKVRIDDPATYLKIVGALVPRQLILERETSPSVDYADLSNEELVEIIDRKQREKAVKNVLIALK
jgi:hypothetical protein